MFRRRRCVNFLKLVSPCFKLFSTFCQRVCQFVSTLFQLVSTFFSTFNNICSTFLNISQIPLGFLRILQEIFSNILKTPTESSNCPQKISQGVIKISKLLRGDLTLVQRKNQQALVHVIFTLFVSIFMTLQEMLTWIFSRKFS